MADYNIRYRISYYRFSGGQTTIDILEKGYIDDEDGDSSSGEGPKITTLTAGGTPLEISREGSVTNIYKPTIGSGAVIKVIAQPLTLKNLFTIDPQKFMVKIYNGASGVNMFWQGFVNAGIYTESYSTPESLEHEITIYCNDGMSVLEDTPYEQTFGGSPYTGFVTIASVMDNILSKIDLDFTYVRTNQLLTYGEGIYAGTTNLFTALKVNNENYYDEDGVAMSCRQVIDSIFSSLGWVCAFRGSLIMVVDPLDSVDILHGHRYDASPFGSNEASLGLGEHLDISNGDVAWEKTGQVIDIIMPFNYIELKYDPYTFTDKGYDFNATGNPTFGNYGEYTDNGVTYKIHEVTMKDWSIVGTGVTFTGYEQTTPNPDTPEVFIRMLPDAGATEYFEYTFPFSNIKQDDNMMLEVSMSVFVNTRHLANIWNPDESSSLVASLYMYGFQLKIGDKYYDQPHGSGGVWSTDTSKTFEVYVREMDAEVEPSYYIHGTWFRRRKYVPEYDTSEIQDKRVTAFVHIPLSEAIISSADLLNGSITLRIPKKLTGTPLTNILCVLIGDINISMVNTKKLPLTNDGILAKGTISDALHMKKSDLTINLTTGIGPYGSSKGAISSDLQTVPGVNITGLKRYNTSTFYTTNQLLLQSLLSQYRVPRYKITGCLDVKDWVYDYGGLGMLSNLILDSAHLTNDDASTKKFYICSSTYRDREEEMDVEMIEIANSRQDITS